MKRRLLIGFVALCAAIFAVSLTLLVFRFGQAGQEEASVRRLTAQKRDAELAAAAQVDSFPEDTQGGQDEKVILPAYRALYERNPDLVGWIAIEGTDIDHPVMRREVEYYLTHDFDGNPSSSGLPFMDQNVDPQAQGLNLIIHGHNMKDGRVFHDLLCYRDASFSSEHDIVSFDTLHEKRRYQVIAALELPLNEDFSIYAFSSTADEAQVEALVRVIEAHSRYLGGFTLNAGDDLLTLSTCGYHAQDGRFVVLAVRVDSSE